MSISINENYVDASAPNAGAIKNGRDLVGKGKFVALHKSTDGTLIFGECSGSGKSNYHCSSDFIDPDNPTHRCSCPSRQFPCKHCLGLMYAFVQGRSFTDAEIPEDIASKREKSIVRKEKRKETADKPRTVNKSALKKKITAQLAGLDVLDKLLDDILRRGLGTLDAKSAVEIENQAKQLGDAFLPGAQAALHEFTGLFKARDGYYQTELTQSQRDHIYREALERLTSVHALSKRGRDYLSKRADDPDLTPETETSIAAWLGHAWQLRELEEAGCMETDAELLQLAFQVEDHPNRREWVDVGLWVNLKSGALQRTMNFRPYKAAKYIREDDSAFNVACVPKLLVYPGETAPRIRWEESTTRPATPADCEKVRSLAAHDFAEMAKSVKGMLKSPLADRSPFVLLHYQRIGKVGDEHVAEDAQGNRIVLVESANPAHPATLATLPILPPEVTRNQTLLGRIHFDWDKQRLTLEPATIVTEERIVRLGY